MVDDTRIAYFNGEYLPLHQVRISPLDRGFLFADGVYEVIPVYNGWLFRLEDHLERLAAGLAAIALDLSLSHEDWRGLFETLVAHNGGGDQSVYLQITRGAPEIRDHNFPATPVKPTIFAMANPLKTSKPGGWSAATVADIRWDRCDIKSIALLPNVLARQQGVSQGMNDVIMIRDGLLSECAAGNVYIVKDGVIRTPVRNNHILPGITLKVVLELAERHGLPCREEDIPASALEDADEVWVSSSTKEVVPITHIDGKPVGDGEPGPVWENLWNLYQDYKLACCPSPGNRP